MVEGKNDINKKTDVSVRSENINDLDISMIKNRNLKEDLRMINEFIEFKLFKKIMNQNDNKKN